MRVFGTSILWIWICWAQICYVSAKEVKVNSSIELKKAIEDAKPGDTIVLGPTTFSGEFVITHSGTSASPITISGSRSPLTKINGTSSGETAFTVEGNHWELEGLSISGYKQAVMVKGTGNKLRGMAIQGVTNGIDIEGKGNRINGCSLQGFSGHGIRVHADDTQLNANSIMSSSKEQASLILEDGSCCGSVIGTSVQGAVKLKGTDYFFKGVSIQGPFEISGCGNSFTGTMAPKPVVHCEYKDLGSNMFM